MQARSEDPVPNFSVTGARPIGYRLRMWRFPWLCAHLPLAIAAAIEWEAEDKARPVAWVQTHEDNFPAINPPSCDG